MQVVFVDSAAVCVASSATTTAADDDTWLLGAPTCRSLAGWPAIKRQRGGLITGALECSFPAGRRRSGDANLSTDGIQALYLNANLAGRLQIWPLAVCDEWKAGAPSGPPRCGRSPWPLDWAEQTNSFECKISAQSRSQCHWPPTGSAIVFPHGNCTLRRRQTGRRVVVVVVVVALVAVAGRGHKQQA